MSQATQTNVTDIFAHQNFGQPLGMGKFPALVLVDFVKGFSDPNVFGGGNIVEASQNTERLLEECRTLGLPIAHAKIVYKGDGSDANLHTIKVPKLLELTPDNPDSDFVAHLKPRNGEAIIKKRLPSAFFGTDLLGILLARGVDTVLIVGCTTSGCIRATALDALCNGLRPIVVEDCVGDRDLNAHKASLFDLGKKYADIISRDQVIELLRQRAHAS